MTFPIPGFIELHNASTGYLVLANINEIKTVVARDGEKGSATLFVRGRSKGLDVQETYDQIRRKLMNASK